MRRFCKRLLLVLGSTLFALLIGEVAVRVLHLGPTPPPAAKGKGPVMPSEDPLLKWEPRPGSFRQWTYRAPNGAERVARAEVNLHGARGPLYELEKPEHVFRIVALGDSFTFGTGVGEADTWPAALSRSLERQRATSSLAPCEVWNFGVEGYDTPKEIRLLRERILPLGVDPDLVVIAFFFNDVEDGSIKAAPLTGWRKTLMSLCNESPKGLVKWVREHSRLAETIAYHSWRRILTDNWTSMVSVQFEDGLSGWETVKTALREGRDLARERGFEFVVALYPPLWREGEHLASHGPYKTFEAFCAAESIPCVNLDPVLDPLPVEQFWIHPRNHHPDPACHEIVGGAIGGFLVEEGFVPAE